MAKVKVLIVDNLAHVRQGLRTLLQLAEDLEIAGEATDGFEAIRMAEQLRPDIVVMDLKMPQLDGFEATQQIKDRRLASGVVALTLYGHRCAREKAASVGVDAFVEKVEPTETVIEAIRRVWGQVEMGDE